MATKDPKRILFLMQEMNPYIVSENPMHAMNLHLPEYFQSHGFETRIFAPKLGEISERRHQLHDVIRLSGQNIIVNGNDHPLLIKVASIPTSRLQVYFIDNDEYFGKRRGYSNEKGWYADNDERAIFFVRGVLETLKKLCWTPDIIYCSGWLSSLAPLYIKRAYAETPFFKHAKVVMGVSNMAPEKGFGTDFAQKMLSGGITHSDIRGLEGFEVGHEELMRLAIEHSDALIFTEDGINPRLLNYAETKNKVIKKYEKIIDDAIDANNEIQTYYDFMCSLLPAPAGV